jgi:hypothetical protein
MAQKIIVDTDPGVDDVLAILLSLSSPEVSVALISIVFGNTHAPVAHKNLLKIYHALAKEIMDHPEACKRYEMKEKTILALGEDGPIGGEKATAAYFVCPFLLSSSIWMILITARTGWIIKHFRYPPSLYSSRDWG